MENLIDSTGISRILIRVDLRRNDQSIFGAKPLEDRYECRSSAGLLFSGRKLSRKPGCKETLAELNPPASCEGSVEGAIASKECWLRPDRYPERDAATFIVGINRGLKNNDPAPIEDTYSLPPLQSFHYTLEHGAAPMWKEPTKADKALANVAGMSGDTVDCRRTSTGLLETRWNQYGYLVIQSSYHLSSPNRGRSVSTPSRVLIPEFPSSHRVN